MRLFVLVACLAAFNSAAIGQPIDQRLLDAWQDWLDGSRLSTSEITVARHGKPVARRATQDAAGRAFMLASVSKHLTGMCILGLADHGRIDLSAPVSQYLPSNRAASTITISELLTHTGGLQPDSTQDAAMGWWLSGDIKHAELAQSALNRDLKDRGAHFYNNENYAILGYVIERVTGTSFVEACDPFIPFEMRLDPEWAATGAFAGIAGTSEDIAISVYQLARSQPEKRVAGEVGTSEEARYSAGLLTTTINGKRIYAHSGRVCISQSLFNRQGGGAYIAAYPDGWSVGVTWDGCVRQRQIYKIEQALSIIAMGL